MFNLVEEEQENANEHEEYTEVNESNITRWWKTVSPDSWVKRELETMAQTYKNVFDIFFSCFPNKYSKN